MQWIRSNSCVHTCLWLLSAAVDRLGGAALLVIDPPWGYLVTRHCIYQHVLPFCRCKNTSTIQKAQHCTYRLPDLLSYRLILYQPTKYLVISAFFLESAAVDQHGGASLLVIDPPWENASARRSGAYGTLTPNHLLYLPVKQLLRQVGIRP